MGKVNSTQVGCGGTVRASKLLRHPKETLGFQNAVAERREVFDGVLDKQSIAKGRTEENDEGRTQVRRCRTAGTTPEGTM